MPPRNKEKASISNESGAGGTPKGSSPSSSGTSQVLRMRLPLLVSLTPQRRAVAGAEHAALVQEERDLDAAKKASAAEFKRKIDANKQVSIPLGQALIQAREAEMAGATKPLVVPLEVQCEARAVPGKVDTYDVFRMDTDPPSFVKQVFLPKRGQQQGIPGVPMDPPDEEKEILEDLRNALKDVDFPDDEGGAPTPPDEPGNDDDDDGPLG